MTLPVYSFTTRTAWKRVLTTNSTNDTALAAKDATLTAPTESQSTGYFSTQISSARKANMIHAILFGSDAANEVFVARFTGWSLCDDKVTYVPITLIELTCTLGAPKGIAGGEIVVADLVCDTLVLLSGDSQAKIISPADNTGNASVLFDPMGCDFIQFEIDRSTAASGNALYSLVS